jgi:uncharacterized protein YbbC (DUF1343 family)
VVLLLLGAAASCAAPAEDAPDAGSEPRPAGTAGAGEVQVLPGLDVLLADSLHLVRGKRIGLVTNHTGVSSLFPVGAPDSVRSGVNILHEHPELDLVALYSPEHGLSGAIEAGVRIESGRHESTGLPIYSLYTDAKGPLPHMLEGVDVLLFDIQDVGARYYTYVYTMAFSMQAAGQAGIPFVVLDRPNPIGGVLVQGSVLDPAFASFIGMYPVPMRHGMTPGELARLYRGAFGVDVELHVVPVAGWRRAVWYDEIGLPWTPPSPNMPSLESATHYPGTCLFEGTNLSVGRGSENPFQWIGAPWLDGVELAARLNAYSLPGVRFEAVTFTPQNPGDAKWPGTTVQGVRIIATDRTGRGTPHGGRPLAVERTALRPPGRDRPAADDDRRGAQRPGDHGVLGSPPRRVRQAPGAVSHLPVTHDGRGPPSTQIAAGVQPPLSCVPSN